MSNEEQLVAHKRGKWSVPDVPHKGWQCVDIEDLGEPQVECEMCESQTIRFVHHMEHPSYSGSLAVGCVCAGHMEGSVSAACDREATMRSRSGKRSRWLSRVWKISAKGTRPSRPTDFGSQSMSAVTDMEPRLQQSMVQASNMRVGPSQRSTKPNSPPLITSPGCSLSRVSSTEAATVGNVGRNW